MAPVLGAIERTTALLALGVLMGCQAPSPAASPPDATAPYCPTTLTQTIGAPCEEAGLLCGPEYTCDLIQVSLVCVCSNAGFFQCTDGFGNVLDGGSPPVCPPAPEAGSCPPTEDMAASAACADQGLLCTYVSPCGGGLDQCQCFPGTLGDGGVGLLFECQQAYCGSEAGSELSDSGADAGGGPSNAPADGGSDATDDVPESGDAAADDD